MDETDLNEFKYDSEEDRGQPTRCSTRWSDLMEDLNTGRESAKQMIRDFYSTDSSYSEDEGTSLQRYEKKGIADMKFEDGEEMKNAVLSLSALAKRINVGFDTNNGRESVKPTMSVFFDSDNSVGEDEGTSLQQYEKRDIPDETFEEIKNAVLSQSGLASKMNVGFDTNNGRESVKPTMSVFFDTDNSVGEDKGTTTDVQPLTSVILEQAVGPDKQCFQGEDKKHDTNCKTEPHKEIYTSVDAGTNNGRNSANPTMSVFFDSGDSVSKGSISEKVKTIPRKKPIPDIIQADRVALKDTTQRKLKKKHRTKLKKAKPAKTISALNGGILSVTSKNSHARSSSLTSANSRTLNLTTAKSRSLSLTSANSHAQFGLQLLPPIGFKDVETWSGTARPRTPEGFLPDIRRSDISIKGNKGKSSTKREKTRNGRDKPIKKTANKSQLDGTGLSKIHGTLADDANGRSVNAEQFKTRSRRVVQFRAQFDRQSILLSPLGQSSVDSDDDISTTGTSDGKEDIKLIKRYPGYLPDQQEVLATKAKECQYVGGDRETGRRSPSTGHKQFSHQTPIETNKKHQASETTGNKPGQYIPTAPSTTKPKYAGRPVRVKMPSVEEQDKLRLMMQTNNIQPQIPAMKKPDSYKGRSSRIQQALGQQNETTKAQVRDMPRSVSSDAENAKRRFNLMFKSITSNENNVNENKRI